MEKQSKKQVIEPAVNSVSLAVDYWRGRFVLAYEQYEGPTELANILKDKDDEFDGIRGFRRIENICRGKGGEAITQKAVLLMEAERPPQSKKSALLKRQKLITS